jgi:MFS family permease
MVAVTAGLIGRTLSVVAIPWFVLVTTGSAAQAGLVAAAVLLPGFVVGMIGGVWVDRLGYRRVSVASDLLAAVATMLIPLLYATVGLSFPVLLVLVFLGSLLDVPALTARRSMVPELAARAGMPVDRVNAWFESLQNLAFLIGTPLAGVLVAWHGARNVLWIDAGASALSALIVLLAVPAALFAKPEATPRRYWEDVLVGLRFIRRDAVLWPMVIVLALSNATSVATAGVILPVYFQQEYGSAASLGLVLAATGGGAFLGATAYGAFVGRVRRRLIWNVAFLMAPLEFAVFLVSPPVLLLVAVYALVGFLLGPINPIMVTLRHERSPLEIRGRVFSTYSAIAMAAQPLGVLVTGNLVDGIGFNPTIAILTGAGLALGVSSLLLPGFRHMDDAPLQTAHAAPVSNPAA